jgi:hypothetical protein
MNRFQIGSGEAMTTEVPASPHEAAAQRYERKRELRLIAY